MSLDFIVVEISGLFSSKQCRRLKFPCKCLFEIRVSGLPSFPPSPPPAPSYVFLLFSATLLKSLYSVFLIYLNLKLKCVNVEINMRARKKRRDAQKPQEQ